MRGLVFVFVMFLTIFANEVEAHDFKIGDSWFLNLDGGSIKFNVTNITDNSANLIGKFKKNSFELNVLFNTKNMIEIEFGEKGSKENIKQNTKMELKGKEYISQKKIMILSKKQIKMNELYINKFLTLKEGTYLYFPLPSDWKPLQMRKKHELLKFKFYQCNKLRGTCDSSIDIGGDRIFLTIHTPDMDIHNKRDKGFILSIHGSYNDTSMFSYAGYYYALERFNYEISISGNNYGDDNFFVGDTAQLKGKIFTRADFKKVPRIVWFNIDENKISELVEKKNKETTTWMSEFVLYWLKYKKVTE